ncbi:MAG TPA: hypothetical protein DHW02_06230 [Ktedonobacter sp.]|nr:hypothetical protein [Ktedonobacter sp.]
MSVRRIPILRNTRIRLAYFLIPALFLAVWRLRQTWAMLLVTGIAILAAVMFACAVPLYSYTAATAGQRSVLSSPSCDANIRVHATMRAVSTQIATTVTHQVEALTTSLSPYLNASPQFALRTRGFQSG